MPQRSKIVTTPERSRLMSRVRQTGTSLELIVRSMLDSLDVSYETNVTDLPGTPDLVNRYDKWAVFVHGCFWHAHQGCKRATLPKRNRGFWKKKFYDNRERDRQKVESLQKIGYSVLVIWECEVEHKNKLREKLRRFVIRESPENVWQEFKYSQSDKSVVKIIHLPKNRQLLTWVRLGKWSPHGEDARSAFDYVFLRKRTRPQQPQDSHVIRAVDLFCGCGGLSLGAMEACRALGIRFSAVAAVDNNAHFLQVYRANFPDSKTYECFVENVTDGDIGSKLSKNESSFIEEVKPVDIVLAGPPCQGNSDLNNHTRRNDERNTLYERVARFVEISHPDHVLIENVPTVIHSQKREVQHTLELIHEMKYNVDDDVVDLSLIGVPQKRKRHVLVASESKNLSISEIVEKYRVHNVRTTKWAIGDLENDSPKSNYSTPSRLSKKNIERIKYLHENDLYDLPNSLRPECHRGGKHSYRSAYGRIRYDEPSQTITSGFMSPGQGRYVHPTQLRTITPHEAARLQFFPDFFRFDSVKTRRLLASGIGNAAPWGLAYIFCLELLS